MLEKTFLFYDIETTGLNKAFDQVLHFAAIRTDKKLNELDRYDIKIKLNPDVIPAPRALITHQIGIREASEGINEFDAMHQIHRLLNYPGTTSLGYNTLGFDDEFLRFSFYRNLLPPYTHQFANQCSRMDLYPIAVMYFLFKNNSIKWPDDNLKLENINAANQFISGRSHHAMVDVEVTLELARRFFAEPEMWQYVTNFFNKTNDQSRFQQIQNTEVLMIDGIFGNTHRYQAPMLFLGHHRYYKNQTNWLRLDKIKLDNDSKPEALWSTNKKWGEAPFILPMQPRFLEHLSEERLTLVQENLHWLKNQPDFLTEIQNHFCEYQYPILHTTDIDARLYLQGFWSPAEENFCKNFIKGTPQEKSQMIEHIDNPTLRGLAIRILGRHFPEALSFKQMEAFANYLKCIRSDDDAEIPHDFKGEKRLNPRKALLEIAEMRATGNLSDVQTALLDELEKYLTY